MSGNKTFLSCIKIKGLHFLPPVIDEEKSRELRKYKEDAIKLEKYLHNSKVLQTRLQELSSTPKLLQTTVGNRTKHASLSTDIVDITEYSNEGINVIDDGSYKFGKEGQTVFNGSKSSPDRRDVQFLFSRQSNKEITRRDSLPVQITSDSFKDESPPKPRLIRSNSYTLETPSPLLLAYLEKEGVIKNSTENNLSLECSDHDSISTVIIKEDGKREPTTPKLEVIQTDISVQHISVNAQNGEGDSSLITDDQLVELLKNIPEEYSKKIINLIHQHKETKKDDSLESEFSDVNTERPGTNECSEKSSLCTTSPSYSFYHTVSSSNTPLPSVNQLSKLESEALVNTQRCILDDYDDVSIRKCRKLVASEYAKRNQAASVIGAHIKGYLTRRLLKTERVQSIIKTIKDALMCALQMHNSDHIDQSDVELHRRLLNQVNAACYAFHDIFFALSVREQMLLISVDRERIANKEKRPYSAPSSRKSSTTPKSQFRSVMSKSLTKI